MQVTPAFSVYGYFPVPESGCSSRVHTWVLVSTPALFPLLCPWGWKQGVWVPREKEHTPTCLLLWSALKYTLGLTCPQSTNCRGTRAQWGLQTHPQSQVTKLFPRAHQVTIDPLFLEKCSLWKVSPSSLRGGSWWQPTKKPKSLPFPVPIFLSLAVLSLNGEESLCYPSS